MKLLIFLLAIQVHAEIVYVNMNYSPEEIQKTKSEGRETEMDVCARGAGEPIHQVDGVKGETNGKSNTSLALATLIKKLGNGADVDAIIFSADNNGRGKFSGSQGEITQMEVRELLARFPKLKKSLKSWALPGCYTTTAYSSDLWCRQFSNVKLAMGFDLQAPLRFREANLVLLGQYCKNRKEWVNYLEVDDLCNLYDSLEQVQSTSVSFCNRKGMVSTSYSEEVDETGKPIRECLSYEDMKARCENLVSKIDFEALNKYKSGELDIPKEKYGELNPLRKIYNSIQLASHCASEYETLYGAELPFPPDVLRLIKYYDIKANLAEHNADDLSSYNQAFEEAGLGKYAFGDVTSQSRQELNDKIDAAMAAARSVKDRTLIRVTKCMRKTFVDLSYECSNFDHIGAHARSKSECLRDYETLKTAESNDVCE